MKEIVINSIKGILYIPYFIIIFLWWTFMMFVDFVYERMHRSDINGNKDRIDRLHKELRDLKDEKQRISQDLPLFRELSDQLLNGKILLGIHKIKIRRKYLNSITNDWEPEMIHFYFMYQKIENSDTFFIRAYYAGQIQKYLADRPYFINEPEDHTNAWVFRIEGTIGLQREIHIHQVDTDYHYRNLGIASIGLEHLKKIAIQYGVKRISGKMDYREDRTILQNFYRNRGFQILISETNTNDRFYLLLEGVIPVLRFEYTQGIQEKLQIGEGFANLQG